MAAVVVAAVAWSGCGKKSPKEASDSGAAKAGAGATILFIGVDGGDWEIIEPLIAKGRLPHFASLVRDGATGPLRSIEPMLSPLLWTTMATGKLPEEHGILSFTAYDPKTGAKVPVTRHDRKVDAFWNMLGDYGRQSDIVGWLATWPAESIQGVMVTDRVGVLAYAGGGTDAARPGNISPENRAAEIVEKLVKPSDIGYDEFQRFVHVDRPAFEAARASSFDPKNPANNLLMLYATTQSYRNIARHLQTVDHPDFLGVYFEWVDAVGHLFMHYAPPQRSDTDPKLYAAYKDAVEEAYVLQDEILGELMGAADENTIVMVASDHGFKSGTARPTGSPEIWAGRAAFWHRPDGILCLAGNGIQKGFRIGNASILDIAPTILALQGLPKPADMPGKVLVEAFEPDFAKRLNREPVATLQKQRQESVTRIDDPTAEAELKKLEALGYIARESPDAHNNLGQRYQQQREYAKAIAEFEKSLAIKPDSPSALNNLGQCYLELKEYPKAEAAFSKALTLKPDNVFALNNLAIVHMQRGDLETARGFAERAVAIEPNYANGHLTLGSIYGTMKSWDKAEQEFRKVLAIDPSNARATANLEKIRVARSSPSS